MVLCWIALPILAMLSIFSAKYRRLTKESFECLFKTIVFKKCQSKLDQKIRSDISGTILRFSPSLAKAVYKYYIIFTLAFMALFIWSLIIGGIGVYNYVQYGNCNGPDSDGFCIFDPSGQYVGTSDTDIIVPDHIVIPEVSDDDPIFGNPDAQLTIIEFGCYTCPFTQKAEPIINEVLDYYDGRVNLQFKSFIIPTHTLSFEAALAANCALDQGKYEGYHDLLYDNIKTFSVPDITVFAQDLSLDMDVFLTCFENKTYKDEIDDDIVAGIYAGVQGTPTFFINDQKIVGPKPFKTFKKIIDKELKKMDAQ